MHHHIISEQRQFHLFLLNLSKIQFLFFSSWFSQDFQYDEKQWQEGTSQCGTLSTMLAIAFFFWIDVLYQSKEVPLYSQFTKAFFLLLLMNGCWVLSNTSSASIDTICDFLLWLADDMDYTAYVYVHLVTQSCLILCDHVNYSPPGFSVPGIFHVKILEWVASLSSRGSS